MKLERILVPVDLTDNSQAALDAAAKIARGSGAKLFVVYVEEMLVMTTKFGFPDEVPEGDMRSLARALEQAVPAGAKIPCEHRLLTGPVPQTILEFAEQQRVDLIVIGSHGRRGVSRFLMGSVAEAVVRGAKCPVLIVKPASATASCLGLGIR
jgi:nucleotide-binding universal stress UspA family protein